MRSITELLVSDKFQCWRCGDGCRAILFPFLGGKRQKGKGKGGGGVCKLMILWGMPDKVGTVTALQGVKSNSKWREASTAFLCEDKERRVREGLGGGV